VAPRGSSDKHAIAEMVHAPVRTKRAEWVRIALRMFGTTKVRDERRWTDETTELRRRADDRSEG
jgi:hypothetical protein